MKFIQKLLASLFAILLMVTVIAPNTVFADEEEQNNDPNPTNEVLNQEEEQTESENLDSLIAPLNELEEEEGIETLDVEPEISVIELKDGIITPDVIKKALNEFGYKNYKYYGLDFVWVTSIGLPVNGGNHTMCATNDSFLGIPNFTTKNVKSIQVNIQNYSEVKVEVEGLEDASVIINDEPIKSGTTTKRFWSKPFVVSVNDVEGCVADLTYKYNSGRSTETIKDFEGSVDLKDVGNNMLTERIAPGSLGVTEISAKYIKATKTRVESDDYYTITYGEDLASKILGSTKVFDENDHEIKVNEGELSIDKTTLNATLLGTTDVTISFKGRRTDDDVLAASSKTVKVRVNQAKTDFDVKSATVNYDGYQHNLLVKPDGIDEKVGYVLVYGGVDGEARGYASVVLSPALQNNLRIDLSDADWTTKGAVTLATAFFPGTWDGNHLDLVTVIERIFGNGIALDGLKDALNKVEPLIGLAKTILGNDENVTAAIDAIVEALDGVASSVSVPMTIYLNQAPVNAGAYVVTGVIADINYQFRMDVADLIILPNRNVVLNWDDDTLAGKVFTYEEMAGGFENYKLGAHAHIGENQAEVREHVNVVYAGLDTNLNPIVGLDSGKILMPGTYTETAATIGGNYFADPITRVFFVAREKTQIVANDVTVIYDGSSKAIDYNVVCGTKEHTGLNEKATVIYTKNGLPVTNPVYAGTYRAYVYFPGDAVHDFSYAYATLTIEKAKTGINVDAENVPYDGERHGVDAVVTVETVTEDGTTYVEDAELPVNVRYIGAYGTIYNSNVAPKNAGNYIAIVSYAGDRNHEPSSALKYFRIERAEVTVEVGKTEFTYDGKGHGPVFEVSCEDVTPYVLYKDADSDNWSTEAPVNAGEYEALIKFDGDRNHKPMDPRQVTVIINPLEVTVVADDASKIEGEKDPSFTWHYADDSAKAVEGDDLGIVLDRVAGENPGSYGIYLSTEAETNSNYAITVIPGTLKIREKVSAPTATYVVPNTATK